ncbi:MAG: bifunctional 3,4-dihydroxy-2-butanone-4-phosphate synthase/GTP cyclohydrolase II, partial [Candidatus Gracilibacteria bacterium]|nr:bifunctional 3,4-dihydroxy-2-butanone-4-phosphate synthase/GTP cyclohydrolase II [Candidatus Gracilibacteria bacterium]
GGVLIYLDQEGRGVGLTNKIKAYELQRKGMDTVEANLFLGRENDEREYGIAVTILRDFDLSTVKLLTNNPLKVEALRKEGFRVEKFPIQVELDSERGKRYLKAKREKLGHE